MNNCLAFVLLCLLSGSFPHLKKRELRGNHCTYCGCIVLVNLRNFLAAALLASVLCSRTSSFFCILLPGLWQGLLKFKLCFGLTLRTLLVLELSSSVWDKEHWVVGGEWQVWIRTKGTDGDGACEVRDPPPLLSRGHFQWCRWQRDLCQSIRFL